MLELVQFSSESLELLYREGALGLKHTPLLRQRCAGLVALRDHLHAVIREGLPTFDEIRTIPGGFIVTTLTFAVNIPDLLLQLRDHHVALPHFRSTRRVDVV